MSEKTAIACEDLPPKSPYENKVGVLLAIGMAAIFVVLLKQINHRITEGHSGDFRHFYFAARALLDHTDIYKSGTGGYLYPPLIAMLYTPIARLDYITAQRVILIVDSLLALGGILLTAREYNDRFQLRFSWPWILFVALAGTILNVDKLHGELQMFQTNSLMFFMFALSLYLLDRRPILAGIPLGLIFNIKYLSLGMFPWLLIRKRWWTAGAYAVSALAFAFLPAVISGWQTNARNLSVAYDGLFRMVGVSQGTAAQANVEDIRDFLSCSITSAMARTWLNGGSLKVGMLLAACVAITSMAVVVWRYVYNQVPLVDWPSATTQAKQPWRGVIGLEFTSILAATLCFSPQTNTRHLMMLLLITIPMVSLVVGARSGVRRFPLVVGALILAIGLMFPPAGSFSYNHRLSLMWFGVGGQCWCLLIAVFALMSVGLAQARSLGSFSR